MNSNIWIFIIIMIITGAWTGYITNDVAIKMLFKEYGFGKFKFGGVIVKTRKNLEKNLAQLVEREIINHNTLKSQFHKKELKQAVSKTVVGFFNEAIFKYSENVAIKDIPGFNKTIDNTLSFLKTYMENNLSKVFIDLSRRIELADVISSEQAYNLSVSVTKQLIQIVEEKNLVSDLVKQLYHAYHGVSIDEIIGPDITNIIIGNLNELLNNIFDEMRFKNDRDIQTLISKLYRDLDFDSFVETLETFIGNKKINYFISESSLEKLYDLLTDYLKNPTSHESIDVFCEGLLIALKKIDKPIIELFTGDLRIEVEKFLEEQLPGIVDKLVDIVMRYSHEIEALIESSIDQTIYDQQTIKRIILSAIRMFLIENFTQKYDIINKIVELLKGIDIQDLSKTISSQVVDILHQKSISSLINELELNNILTSQLISTQVHRILSFLNERYLSKDIEHADFLNKTINDIIKLNLKPVINTFTVSVVTKQIVYNEDAVNFVKKRISSSLKEITKLPVEHFIQEDKISGYASRLQEGIISQLNKNYSEILDIVYHRLNDYLVENNMGEVVSKSKDVVFKSAAIVDVIIKSIRNLIDDNNEYKVHDLFAQINSIDSLSENVVNAIMDFLDNGLSSVLEGNIAKVVEDNIKSLSNEEVLEMMQQFMGEKLKPLTVLGGILGAVVGLILAVYYHFSGSNTDIFGFIKPGAYFKELIISVPIYAFLGYITNVAAIFFIFRPYRPVFGLKWFQGIIPKQIPVLAKAMGNVVANNLLSESSINNMLQNNEGKVKKGFFDSVQKEDYKVLKAYLNENSRDIVKGAAIYINKYLRENNNALASKFTEEFLKFDLSKFETTALTELFAKLFTGKVNDSKDAISNYLVNKFKSSITIKELSENLSVDTVEKKINSIVENEIGKFVSLFGSGNFIIDLLKKNSGKIDGLITKDLNSVLPETTKVSVENFIYNLVSTQLFSRDKQRSLSNYVINEITTMLHNNDSIDELFGGRFIELVNFNMYTILERIEDSVKSWLTSHKEDINESVTGKVIEELTVMQQVGYKAINGDKLIRETVYRIIEEKIPDFISRKMDNLNNEFMNFFDNLGKIRLKDAKLELRREELQNYLNDVFESKEIEIKTRRFIHVVMGYFFNFQTGRLFDMLNIGSTQDVIKQFNDAFAVINNGLFHTLNARQDKIVFDVSLIINKFITREILSNRVRNLTLGIAKEDIDGFVNNMLVLLNKDEFLENNITQVIHVGFAHFKKIPLSQLFDDLFLKQDMKKLIRKLTADRQFEEVIYHSVMNLYNVTVEDFNVLVDDELKETILNDIINATYDVINQNLLDILQAVDFKEVTIREINGMEPEQIKDLFDSFGRKYFRKLEGYGVFGGIFAVNVITVLTILYYAFNYIKGRGKNN